MEIDQALIDELELLIIETLENECSSKCLDNTQEITEVTQILMEAIKPKLEEIVEESISSYLPW